MVAERPRAEAATAAMRRARRRIRLDPTAGILRSARSLPATLQIVIAATIAYAVAHFAFGHPTPALSLTVTISSLGFGRDARPKRVAETAIGMILGIALSETFLLLWGTGVWQLSVVLLIVFTIARSLSPSAGFAVAAGMQAMLVMVLPAPEGGVYTRSIDGFVGGLVALLCTVIVPRNPLRLARRDARSLIGELESTVASLVSALRSADIDSAQSALERIRRSQPIIDEWTSSLEAAMGVARLSPFLRRHRGALERQQGMLAALDLATRNLRIIARRTEFLIRDELPRPEIAELLSSLSTGINLIGQSLSNERAQVMARQDLTLIAVTLDPQRIIPDGRIAEKTLVVLLRPFVVDLLTATGMDADAARAALPEL